MKNLYLGLLSLLFGIIFGFSSVKGDIIDPDWNISERTNLEDIKDSDITTESENGDKVYGRLPRHCKNPVFCFFSQNVWFDIVNLVGDIAVFFICVFLLVIISIFPLYNIFKKLGEKGSKSLIPIKNLYCLANLVDTRKFGMIRGGLSILWRFLVGCFIYSLGPCISYDFNGGVHRGTSDAVCGLRNIGVIVSCLPAIIIFLMYDYFALISFYRLFRKFGWNRGYAVLGTIFFPIGACVLGFGNFEYQGENLEKKEGNN